jgi:hypothetical protein
MSVEGNTKEVYERATDQGVVVVDITNEGEKECNHYWYYK